MKTTMIITVLGMAIVFAVLYVLVVALNAMRKLMHNQLRPGFYKKPTVKRIDNEPKQEILPLKHGVGDETAAVIAAAVAAYLGSQYAVKNIYEVRRLRRNADQNAWTVASKMVNTINNKL